ncbi:putative N-acetylglucosamine-6-phosphate deacetylase [Apophysomyces sp. BC1034]|nr:putative N-acetylglucosamine-6-phosphate deacetylase [Apophysomyces sp. BC1015]KAG0181049.1 putative N-acetylglucosamine-6-phosphate deacetylase [Apophysomyces sp. BC1021]KAG0191456.1 putative N-acetylglucosamine-6-phosphate deacetylase [Apophysomyces sp. BC1034]
MPSGKIYKVINARLLIDHKIVENSYLWFQDGKIIHPQNLFFNELRDADEIIDAKGLLVTPGFIDTQINGAYGIDFADHEESIEKIQQDIDTVAKGLLRYGCTAFCPTVVSSEPAVYEKVLPLLNQRKGSANGGAEILGAHVEGPFISVEKKGAHKQAVFRDAKNGVSDFDSAYGSELKKGNRAVAIMTMAPEIEGVSDAIPDLVARGIKVAIGHSACRIAEAEKAVVNGATSITHLFNAMQAFHHRDPGLIGVLGAADLPVPEARKGHPAPSATSPCRSKPDPRPFFGLICDGVHVHPNSIRIAYYSHPTGAVLVTDALSAMGLPEGEYTLGGRQLAIDKNGAAYIKGTDTLAGSTITIDECVRNFQRFTNCTLVEAIEAATLHPAQLLGIEDRKGTLNAGADADLVFLDDSEGEIRIKRVFVAGEEVSL